MPDYNEPNYELAKKVFLDFNDFNLRNIENGLAIYLGFIPKSLLPYPKNYIKCAYYIFLDKLKKENNLKMFSYIVRVMTDNETIIYYSPEKSYMMSSLEDTMKTDIVEGEECCDEAYLIKYRKKFKKHWMKYLIPEDPSITNYKFVVPKGEVKRFQVNKSLM